MSKVQTEYKSTELRDIPQDWELVSLADVADPNKPYALTGGPFGSDLKSEEYTESGVRIIQLQNIKEGYFSNDYKIYTSEEKANQLFNCNIFPNDIIIAKMAEPVARACIIPDLHERYLMASDGIRLAVDEEEYSTKYVMYAINSSYFRQQAIDNSTGTTRLRIGLKTLKGLKLLKPSKEEQQKIVSILSSVDKAIEKTGAIIQQTEKVKKGLMQQLLTKGIGHTKFKKTDIGEIPEEWSVIQFGNLVEIQVGYAFKSVDFVEKGIRLLRGANISPNEIKWNDTKCFPEDKANEYSIYYLEEKDVVIGMDRPFVGGGFKVARITKKDLPALLLQRVARIKFSESLNSDYGYQVLNSDLYQSQLAKLTTGMDLPHISSSNIAFPLIPVPSVEEQSEIASILNKFNQKLDGEKKKISYLRQIKKGLMQSLLTGKVRVNVGQAEVTQE